MTDYGITPPKAMLGMLKTDPKVTVTFETVLSVPLDVAERFQASHPTRIRTKTDLMTRMFVRSTASLRR